MWWYAVPAVRLADLMKPRSTTWLVFWPSWDEIWTENENIGPHEPDSCITHTLTQLWHFLIWGLSRVVWTCCSLLCQRRFVLVCVCAMCCGCVPDCMNKCPSLINEGLHSPPSPLCILLFLVAVWWAKGLELQRLCSLFFSSFTSLPRSAASVGGYSPLVCFRVKRKLM